MGVSTPQECLGRLAVVDLISLNICAEQYAIFNVCLLLYKYKICI
jgi:hypothetical protein